MFSGCLLLGNARANANHIPVADAGPDGAAFTNQTVTLNGSASYDIDGDALTFNWTQIGGLSVTLSDSHSIKPTFVSTVAGAFQFQLIVVDAFGVASETDTVQVQVSHLGTPVGPPYAAIVPRIQAVQLTQVTRLDGSLSYDQIGQALTYQWAQIPTNTTNFTVNPDGKGITINPTQSAELQFQMTITNPVALSSSKIATVVVRPGGNQMPVANAGPDQAVAVNTLVTLDGSLSSDPDGDSITYRWSQVAGPTVTLSSLNAQKPTFTTSATAALYKFDLVVYDRFGLLSNVDEVLIGGGVPINQPPTANAGPDQTVASASLVTLDGSQSSDPDGDAITYAWSQVSGPTISLNDSSVIKPTFTAPVGPATIVMSLVVTDIHGATSAPDQVTININAPPNHPPTANAGPDQTVASASVVTLDGSQSSDPDGDSITYAWSQVSGPIISLNDPTAVKPTFSAPVGPATIVMSLIVTDIHGAASTADQVTINVNAPPNHPPTANAGPDQTVDSSSLVTLDGSLSSDPDGDAITYAWSQVSGPTISLNDPTAVKPTFTAPVGPATIVMSLIVTDIHGAASTADQVTINVNAPPNNPPTANAGPDQTVASASLVTLDGSLSSDPDGDAITYAWSQVSGPTISLNDPTTVKPTFTAPVGPATIVMSLIVTDIHGAASTADQVTINVNAPANNPPIANAGPDQNVASASLVTLDGSQSSDPDGDAITYAWSQISGPAISLDDPTAVKPTFTAPTGPAVAVFSLIVTDIHGAASAADQVIINIDTPPNHAPTANAGPDQTVDSSVVVTLDGSQSSDPDGDALTYAWTQVGGPAISLDNTTAVKPTFTAPVGPAVIVMSLVVTDIHGASSGADQVTITVNAPPNHAPNSDAGPDQTVFIGAPVTLDGSQSTDPDGDALTYAWTQVSGPTISLNDSTAVKPTFTAPAAPAVIVFSLIVTDIHGAASGADQVTITVIAPTPINHPPIANAGPAQTVADAAVVTLDGSLSSDPDGDAITYAWSQVSGPTITLNDPTAVKPTFTAPEGPANIVLSLIVTDSHGAASTADQVAITVLANHAPTVSVAPQHQTFDIGQSFSLVATGADADNDALTYTWSQPAGQNIQVTLSPDQRTLSAVVPTAPNGTLFSFTVTVQDTHNATAQATGDVTVHIVDTSALLAIGVINPATVNEGNTFVLDGSASNPAGLIEYKWDSLTTTLSRMPTDYSSQSKITLTAPQVDQDTPLQFRLSVRFIGTTTPVSVNDQTVLVHNVLKGNEGLTPHPATNAFTVAATDAQIYVDVSSSITLDASYLQKLGNDAIIVMVNKDENNQRLPGTVSYANNRLAFSGLVPSNAQVTWQVNVKDTNGVLHQPSYQFVRAMNKDIGGVVQYDDAQFVIPPGALEQDLLIITEPLPSQEAPPLATTQGVILRMPPSQIYGVDQSNNHVVTLAQPITTTYQQPSSESSDDDQYRHLEMHFYDVQFNRWDEIGKEQTASSAQANGSHSVSGQMPSMGFIQVVSVFSANFVSADMILYPNPFTPSENPVRLRYTLGDPADVHVVIYDLWGNLVRDMTVHAGDQGGLQGVNEITWNGRNEQGSAVGNGGYILKIHIQTTTGTSQDITEKVGVVR